MEITTENITTYEPIISIVEMLTLVSNSSKFLNEKLYNLITYKAHKKW